MPAVVNWVGRVIDGRYVVDSVIGQGGMGVVLRARHKFTSAQVAIKMLNPEFQVNPEVHARFLAEARTPSTIGHPGIVAVHDAGTTPEGELYFAMELLTGRTLRQAMYPSMPPQVTRRIAVELLDALGAAHAHGIIHRDLKPENVFLSGPTGTVKLLDFGIAKVVQTARTHQGALLGTLSYMSPEQVMDASSVDARADLWAVGVMIYEMLSGKLPFRATTLVEVVEAFHTRDADSIRAHLPPTTPWLDKADAFFGSALARDRTRRFSSTQAVAAALSSIGLEDTQITTVGSTLTGVMASRGSHQMTAADSGPSLPRTGVIATPRSSHGTPGTPYAAAQRPSAPYLPSSSQPAAAPVRNVRGSQAPVDDPFPPANPAFVPPADADAGATIPAVPLFGGPSTPQAATLQSPQLFGQSAPAPFSAPSRPPTAPTLPGKGAVSGFVATMPAGSAVPPQASGSPSQPFAVPSSPSQPFAVPASPSAPMPIPPAPPPFVAHVPQMPVGTGPAWGVMQPSTPQTMLKGSSSGESSGLGRTSWIVIGVVIVAFIGFILVFMKMNSDHGSGVTRCEERCKSQCGASFETATCAAVCNFSPTKANECMESSGGSCDTLRTCVLGGR